MERHRRRRATRRRRAHGTPRSRSSVATILAMRSVAAAGLWIFIAFSLAAEQTAASPRCDETTAPIVPRIERGDVTVPPRTMRTPLRELSVGGLPIAFEPAKKFSARHLESGFDPEAWFAHYRWLLLFPRDRDERERTAEAIAIGIAELLALDAPESRSPDPMRRGWPLPAREVPPHEPRDGSSSETPTATVDGATEDERTAQRIALDARLALAISGVRSAERVADDHDLATLEGAPFDVAAAALRIGLHAPTSSLPAALRNDTLDGVAVGILALVTAFDGTPVDNDILDALTGIAKSEAFGEDVRSCAILALGRLDRLDRIANEMRIDDLQLSPYLRAHLVTAMGLTRDPARTSTMLDHTLDLEVHVRWAALRALGGLLDATGRLTGETPLDGSAIVGAREEAMLRLRTMLARRLDPRTRAHTQFALARIAGARAAGWIADANPDVHGAPRAAAVMAIALSGARAAEALALELLLDSSELDDVRAAGALALGIYGEATESTRRRVRGMLSPTRTLCIREAACDALAFLRDIDAMDDLLAIVLAPDEPTPVRSRAAVALARIGSPRAIEALVAVADDADSGSVELRVEILLALAVTPAAEAVPPLVRRARTSPELAIRRAAVRALGYATHPRQAPECFRLLADRNALLVGPIGIASPFEVLRALH